MSHVPDTAATGEGLAGLLLEAKLDVPRRPVAMVSHDALIDAATRSGKRIVGVTAPAGYGKSTLLSQWANHDRRAVMWVSLDQWDDDPLSLLVLIASAFAKSGHAPPGLVQDMIGAGPSVLGRAAPRLASALAHCETPFVLLLDDLHELRMPACHDVLSVVIEAVPAGSQAVISSRAEQPHLPRLRAKAWTVEITAKDLALDADGARQIFANSHVEVAPEVLATVTRRTEGWPAGIYLASLIARHGNDGTAVVSGQDPYVADYLQRESYLRLPPKMRRFLRRTAVLEHLSADLCDAVLDDHNGKRMLRKLESSSLFLNPLDRHRAWFRYHALFREFLLGELMTEEPELVDGLRVRAADWYEAHELPRRAVEILLPTPHRDRCVRLVTQLVMVLFQAGQLTTVGRWLRKLGDDAVTDYPPLAVLAGWVAVYSGLPAEAERWGAVVDAASYDGDMVDGSASFVSAQAMYRGLRCAGGPQQMLDDGELALRSEPEWSDWRDTALQVVAEARLLLDDVERATRDYEQALELAVASGHAESIAFSEAQLALLAIDRGRWEEARERVRRALTSISEQRIDDYPTSTVGFAAAAQLAVHDGDMKEARQQLTRGMRARMFCTYAFPTLAVRARLHLARTNWALGDTATVRHLLREIDDVMVRRPDLGRLRDDVEQLRAELDKNLGGSAPAGKTSPLSPAELRLLPFLQTYLTIGEIAQRLFISRNTASTQIGSIYRKLGVSSRSDAVRQAIARGLLGE